jgi:hypothetical protein
VNVPAILASGQLLSQSGVVYMTQAIYTSRSHAQQQLALEFEPGAAIILNTRDMGPPEPTYVGVVIPR